MALRLDSCVVRGELDNTERGRVTGRLWFAGHENPVTLDLHGDAWPDMAGTRLTFVNPKPRPHSHNSNQLQTEQRGQVGDITASRKCKTFDASDEEFTKAYQEGRARELPVAWKNTLYLEWYSDVNGRVLIESSDFDITISEKQWELDEDEHEAQQMLNLQAMRDYLATVIRREEPKSDEEAKWPDDMTEEEWEESLKASDRLTDAAMEAREKFEDDPDADEKEAFVMGWGHLNRGSGDEEEESEEDRAWIEEINRISAEALEDEKAEAWKESDDVVSDDDSSDEADEEDDEEDDWLERGKRETHPLQRRASDYAMKAMDVFKQLGINEERGIDREHPADRYAANVFQIMGKLAGALNGPYDRPNGMVLATLKRCLNWANEALAALADLGTMHPEPKKQEAFEQLRNELLTLREGITDERRMRQQGGE